MVKKQLKDFSLFKVQTTIQPMFVTRKVEEDLRLPETKPQIVNQQCVVYRFGCADAGYAGYTCGHPHIHVEGHKQRLSSICKHYGNLHGNVPEDLIKQFRVLKKCRIKFDCLVHEILFIRHLKPSLSVQSDSISAKVFIRVNRGRLVMKAGGLQRTNSLFWFMACHVTAKVYRI